MKKIKLLLMGVAALVLAVFMQTNTAMAADAPNYLTFTALEDGSSVTLGYSGGENIQYCKNDGAWIDYVKDTKVELNENEKVSFKGKNLSTCDSDHFSMEGKIAASGSVTSLVDENGSNNEVRLGENQFLRMFSGCEALVSAPELPALNLDEHSYDAMFSGCTGLQEAPELPATVLANNCYSNMFSGCTSLEEAPRLLATTLAESCYERMFDSCDKLKKAPELPATTLAINCYGNMFHYCSSLEEVPELPATTLAERCYESMFSNCSSLKEAPELPATTLAESCYKHMFGGCSKLEEAPRLPATVLASNCYSHMFEGCNMLLISTEEIDNPLVKRKLVIPDPGSCSGCFDNMFKNAGSQSAIPGDYRLGDADYTPKSGGIYYLSGAKEPEPTPTPDPKPTPTPTPDPKPTPNPDPNPTPTPTPDPKPTPSPTPDPKPTPNPDPNPTPSSDPTQSDIPEKEPEEPLLRNYNGNKTIAKAGNNDNGAESEIGGICYMVQQGPLCNAAFAAATPTGFKEAFTFNFSLDTSIYHKTNYDRKRGLFVLNIPETYQKKGRTFRIIGINKNGQTKVFSDSDMDDDTFTTALDVEGYAFSLIYTDSTVKTEKAVTKGSSSSQNDNIYTVKSGDTLSAIARRLGVNLRKLIDRNDLDDPDKLSIGQKISY